MMKKFYIQQNRSFKFRILTDYAQQYVESQWELSRRYRVIYSNKSTALIYENHKADQGYTVDLTTRSCSYKDFKDIQIPCRHAIAAIREFKYAINDFIHEAYYITSYKATYQASFPPINMEELSDDSDCGPCSLRSRRGHIPKKRKRQSRSRPAKRANACSICKKIGHTKCSPLCSGYKPESFFYTRPAIGIKVRESTTSAAKPAVEPAQRRSTRKRKRD